jgi:hypothetical protein
MWKLFPSCELYRANNWACHLPLDPNTKNNKYKNLEYQVIMTTNCCTHHIEALKSAALSWLLNAIHMSKRLRKVATFGTTKTFQILSVPSPAADATMQPSRLWNKYRMKTIRLWTMTKIMARRNSKIKTLSIRQVQKGSKQLVLVHPVGLT